MMGFSATNITKNFAPKLIKNNTFFFEKLSSSNCASNCARTDDFERTVRVRSAPVRVRSAQPYSAGTVVHYFDIYLVSPPVPPLGNGCMVGSVLLNSSSSKTT